MGEIESGKNFQWVLKLGENSDEEQAIYVALTVSPQAVMLRGSLDARGAWGRTDTRTWTAESFTVHRRLPQNYNQLHSDIKLKEKKKRGTVFVDLSQITKTWLLKTVISSTVIYKRKAPVFGNSHWSM